MGWEWLTMSEIAARLVAAFLTAFLIVLAVRMLRAANEYR